jgi:hypothetical protein
MRTKFNFLLAVLLSSLCITFTACSNDDDKDKTTSDYAKEIAGTYIGNIYLDGIDQPIETDAMINITRNENSKVTLKINQTIALLPINVECESDVVYSNEKYQISGEAGVDMGEPLRVPMKINGDIDKAGNATIHINIPQLEVSVVYKGKKEVVYTIGL